MSKIRVALIGVGNCASALVQGVYRYRDVNQESGKVPGVLHNLVGPYRVGDIEFVAAFDVDDRKVGRDLSAAIFAPPNCAPAFADVPRIGVPVMRGPVLDGLGPALRKVVPVNSDSGMTAEEVAWVLKDAGTHIVINFLPTGSRQATNWYVERALEAGCAFLNAIPEPVATSSYWVARFKEAALPVVGDDIKSQFGSTILHRSLLHLLRMRGVGIRKTYQVNIGGGGDFINLADGERSNSKLQAKLASLRSELGDDTEVEHPRPQLVGSLGNTKVCHIHVNGVIFGDRPISVDARLSVEDSPNAAGVLVDVVRALKIALDRGLSGTINDISAWFFKNPPVQVNDEIAGEMFEAFISAE